MIQKFVADWDLSAFDFLFIRNVGNLVCPASYDLGETLRVVLFSTTEARISRSNTRRCSIRRTLP